MFYIVGAELSGCQIVRYYYVGAFPLVFNDVNDVLHSLTLYGMLV